jgi:DNA replication protein DnaC
MTKDLLEKLNYLRLKALPTHWDDYLKLAADRGYSDDRLLKHVIDEEYRLRLGNACQQRLRRARIPEPWSIETFPFERQPRLNKKQIMALYDSLSFMTQNQNIIWLGGTGCGKTGLATSFLTHAIHNGHTACFVRFADLIHELYQSVADHSEVQVLKKYFSYSVLLIDEIGYIEVEPVQVGLFFTLMQQRHKKKSTLITSNLGFSEWGKFLKNDALSAALMDRLTESSHIFNLKQCTSLRTRLNSDSQE